MESKPMALVVEDDPDLNTIFSSALEKAGYAVKSLYDGAPAKVFLTKTVPAIIILDLHLTKVNGDVLLKHIRSEARLKNVRVIIATADATFAQAPQFESELVLLKPVSFSQLHQLAIRFAPGPISLDDELDN